MTSLNSNQIKSVCVYCGAGLGSDPSYEAAARLLGQRLASENIRLIYGGASIGLMGTVAEATLEAGGQVTGIIPHFLKEREVMLASLKDLVITRDMHERKQLMFEKSDGFIALPGGIGTLEEAVEMMTWGQLGQHRKPIVLANINGFWSPLLELLDHMRAQGFIRPETEVPYLVARSVDETIPLLTQAISCPETDSAPEYGVAPVQEL
ncbi:TIGR00730 family Rossman fold protein [Roseibium sp. RKSG952]|uniref:LOG family protein n=1 Tax=Roseibium sp. RKSG952 TaxID=2529384 RepID=UPI0012BD0972|nr:TIGR00730 family Rossman fold protein [Roseibium sp. RKSG952]MTI00348.1 TIGR00730 family Rossman fold protein [Roseibium sp. RKSG952]